MKKFKYRAEPYLKFLSFTRERALGELKKAENFKNSLLIKYSRMENRMKEAFKVNSEVGQVGREINYINDNNKFINMLKVQMENLSIEIQQADIEYKEKLKSLLDLQLKVKKIELHKESELEKYKKVIRKKSQKLTDEINGTRKRGHHAESI